MIYTFRAKKMLDRISGKPEYAELINDEMIEFIKMLDGKKGTDYNWESVVNGENMVLIKADGDLKQDVYVNSYDCD